MKSLVRTFRPRNEAPFPHPTRGGFSKLFGGGGKASPQQQIDAYGANGTLHAIVSRSSQAQSAVEWKLFRKAAFTKSGLPEEITSHAVLDLWERPNPHYTHQHFVESQAQHLELVGAACWVVARNPASTLPLELWPVRPDRITPVPSRTEFLAGYIYTGPDGEKVPLGVDEVIRPLMPDPDNPYYGLGPVQSIMRTIDAIRFSQEWNATFFKNSAEPGGILRMKEGGILSDDDFDMLKMRWDEQHRGVSSAHRVAIIEGGLEWQDRNMSMRDMQFVELQNVGREVIREAFGYPKPMLGAVDDINRSNAEAGEVVFSKWFLNPRCDKTKDALNYRLIPMYYPPGAPLRLIDIEFDYLDTTPVSPDDVNAERDSQAKAAKELVEVGYDPDDVCDFLGIPRMRFAAPPKAPAPAQGQPSPSAHAHVHRLTLGGRPLNAEKDPRPGQMAKVQKDWEKALDALLADWTGITKVQRAEIRKQVQKAVDAGDLAKLAELDVDTDKAAGLLKAAMVGLSATAAGRVVEEAKQQDIDIDPVEADEGDLSDRSTAAAGLLGTGLANAAGREALRLAGPSSKGSDIADATDEFLDGLSDRYLADQLGGALTAAQNAARFATMDDGPEAAYYANEMNDANTCQPCDDVDGKWLGNSVDAVEEVYPNGGYIDCEGGIRCRGTVTAIWRGGSADKWFESEDAPGGD